MSNELDKTLAIKHIQPKDIAALLDNNSKKIMDDDGWTGEWSVSAKDVLDLIFDLQKSNEHKKYYYLKEGEIVEEGDEVEMSASWKDPAKWVKTNCAGHEAPNPHFTAHRKYRRLKK